MSISAAKVQIESDPAATEVRVSDDSLPLMLVDGRELSAPLAWFAGLRDADARQRGNWRLIGDGIHWPELDEDISVRALLGRPS